MNQIRKTSPPWEGDPYTSWLVLGLLLFLMLQKQTLRRE